jgi:transcriptional regulator with XRE-family HTH domain
MDRFGADIAKRLAAAMKAAGYEAKPSVLEREFNQRHWGKPITLQDVRRWLRGEVIPPHSKIMTLAEWLHVTPRDLFMIGAVKLRAGEATCFPLPRQPGDRPKICYFSAN